MMSSAAKMPTLTIWLLMNWFWRLCYGFVLIASSARANDHPSQAQLFALGTSLHYTFASTVRMNELGADVRRDVGFHISGRVRVDSVWQKADEQVIKVALEDLQLYIRSEGGFTPHSSRLEALDNRPYYVVLNNGHVEKVLMRKDEPLPLSNLKKGIASLLQFQTIAGEYEENDVSGHCTAIYTTSSPDTITKIKQSCTNTDLLTLRNNKPLLDTLVTPTFTTTYQIAHGQLVNISSYEKLSVSLAAQEDVGSVLVVQQELVLQASDRCAELQAADLEALLMRLNNEEGAFTLETLLSEREILENAEQNRSFEEAVYHQKDNLRTKLLGTLVSAKGFQQVINAARRASKDDIAKTIKAKSNKKILPQLYDVLGYVQTSNSHHAVTKALHFDDSKKQDLVERYLWALSLAAQPNPEIIADLISKLKKTQNIPEKVRETMVLSIASMAHHQVHTHQSDHKLFVEVESLIVNYLDASKDEARFVYLRALKNLRSPGALPTLLNIIQTGTPKEGVLAWKAINALPAEQLTTEVHNAAIETYFQLRRRHDSSSRTLALDVILSSEPSDQILLDILHYLLSDDTAYEVKRYTLERLAMWTENDPAMSRRLKALIASNSRVNNYSTLGARGLSVALQRRFIDGASSNGTLLTVQEMYNGIVKRGIVNVVLDKDGFSQEMFSLGIFSGGLGSFLSSDNAEEKDDENAIAGMELTVLGTQIRPFVFFNGQSELMGHVWSATASDRTPAFQALVMLQDHQQYVRLGNGMIAEVDVKGDTSFDLSGQIQLSLWNRNAQSLVEKSAGISIIGVLRVDTTFVNSRVEFTLSAEPKLKLETDVDFSGNVNLCMKLMQPDTIYRHFVYKIERIPGSKHKLRQMRSRKYIIPGRTYALNKKNSDMCNVIAK